jgi:hypothetical protein
LRLDREMQPPPAGRQRKRRVADVPEIGVLVERLIIAITAPADSSSERRRSRRMGTTRHCTCGWLGTSQESSGEMRPHLPEGLHHVGSRAVGNGDRGLAAATRSLILVRGPRQRPTGWTSSSTW